MSEPISESLRALQRIGADAFGDTALAADVGPTVRRVGRRRVGRAVGTVAAAVALVAAVTVGALGYSGRTISPGGPTPTPTATAYEGVDAVSVTVEPGLTAEQIIRQLEGSLGIPDADFELALGDPASIGLPAEANGSVEGWLAPGTYRFDPAATAADLLSALVNATLEQLNHEGAVPGDRQRVLTVASLIEREAKLDVDRPYMGRVIYNRLDAGMPLGLDSTRQYAARQDGVDPTSQAARQIDSPYNTYHVMGLPPGPIASPSEASIYAALHPADGTWLYFVVVNLDTGETRYATTYEEVVANVELRQAWIAANG